MWFVYAIISFAILLALVAVFTRRKRTRLFDNSRGRAAIIGALLSLDEEPLAELFRLYRQKFGPGPARYARHTYEKWKQGQVKPTRNTFNRLAIHLPTVMSFDLKCELLRSLKREFCGRDEHELTVYTDSWKESLAPLVTN